MRAPVLLLGLGNRLAGDDGVGAHIVTAVKNDPLVPSGVEIREGGSDLLRLLPHLDGRRHLVIVDALLDPARAGEVTVVTDTECFEMEQPHAHQLSAVQALALMRRLDPGLARTACTWVAIAVSSATLSRNLSPELSRALPGIVQRVLGILHELTGTTSSPGAVS
jgi:hydrogenase maturation protease